MVRKVLLTLGVLLVVAMLFMVFGRKYYTKRFSPEDHAALKDDQFEVLVFYNRPYKRNRQIFGGLVPYGKVWRTGANEATWFETNKNLNFGNQLLKEGRYSLWTIPNEKTWTVIFNSTIPPWGVDYNSEAARTSATDVLTIDVPVTQTNEVVEQFTITFAKIEAGYEMNFLWDKTSVTVPFSINGP